MAALEQQLRAVTLHVPPTPPTTPSRRDNKVGLVYDACMELHQGPSSTLPSSASLPRCHLGLSCDGSSFCPCFGLSLHACRPAACQASVLTSVYSCDISLAPAIWVESEVTVPPCADHVERPARTAEMFKLISEQGLAARCWTLPARKVRTKPTSPRCEPQKTTRSDNSNLSLSVNDGRNVFH